MKWLLTSILLLGTPLIGAPLSRGGEQATQAAVQWLEQSARAIHHIEPGPAIDDLHWLGDMVDGIRLVAAGEATHGTRDFFQLKHRLFQYLVVKQGYRTFAIEANFSDALQIDHYIKTGEGDPEQLVHNMGYWTWDTEEVVELVRWMRSYNRQHEEKLNFYGFDVQDGKEALSAALVYLDKAKAAELENLRKPFELILSISDDMENRAEAVRKVNSRNSLLAIQRAAIDLYLYMREHREELIAATSFIAYQHGVGQALAASWAMKMATPELFRFSAGRIVTDVRDRGMADLVNWIWETEGEEEKVFLWAHNGHVGKKPLKHGRLTMGMMLAEQMGEQFLNIGFAFDHGGFQAKDPDATAENRGKLVNFVIDPAQPGSLEYLLAQLSMDTYLVDLRSIPRGSQAEPWFITPRRTMWTGAVYSQALEAKHPPIEILKAYDSLLFVSQTQRARPTRLQLEKQSRLGK